MMKWKYGDGAHVVFYRPLSVDSKGNSVLAVLLYKRTQDAEDEPGYWSLFGGMLENIDNGDPERAVKTMGSCLET